MSYTKDFVERAAYEYQKHHYGMSEEEAIEYVTESGHSMEYWAHYKNDFDPRNMNIKNMIVYYNKSGQYLENLGRQKHKKYATNPNYQNSYIQILRVSSNVTDKEPNMPGVAIMTFDDPL